MEVNQSSRTSPRAITRSVGAILSVGVLGALFAGQASAACVVPTAASGLASLNPSLLYRHAATAVPVSYSDKSGGAQRIVGTWKVDYAAGGNVYASAFIQWHSDGTEWENINFPILGGNICLGEWRSVDGTHFARYHVGWLYNDGVLAGHFIETEIDELSRDGNSYTGTNSTVFYDTNDKPSPPALGTAAAKRIAP